MDVWKNNIDTWKKIANEYRKVAIELNEKYKIQCALTESHKQLSIDIAKNVAIQSDQLTEMIIGTIDNASLDQQSYNSINPFEQILVKLNESFNNLK